MKSTSRGAQRRPQALGLRPPKLSLGFLVRGSRPAWAGSPGAHPSRPRHGRGGEPGGWGTWDCGLSREQAGPEARRGQRPVWGLPVPAQVAPRTSGGQTGAQLLPTPGSGAFGKTAKASDSPVKCCLGTCGPQGVPQPGRLPRGRSEFGPVCLRTQGPRGGSHCALLLTLNEGHLCSQPRGRRPPSLPPPRPAPGPQAALAAPTPPGHRLQSGPSLPGDGYYLAVGGAAVQHNWSYILSVLQDQRFRCQLIDSSEDLGLISIQGPAR